VLSSFDNCCKRCRLCPPHVPAQSILYALTFNPDHSVILYNDAGCSIHMRHSASRHSSAREQGVGGRLCDHHCGNCPGDVVSICSSQSSGPSGAFMCFGAGMLPASKCHVGERGDVWYYVSKVCRQRCSRFLSGTSLHSVYLHLDGPRLPYDVSRLWFVVVAERHRSTWVLIETEGP